MTNLEEKVENIEKTIKEEVALQVSNMKDEIITSLKSNNYSVVDSRNKELEDRKRRELNHTIFNLKEHRCDSETENKRCDEHDLQNICESLGLGNLSVITSYRLGRKDESRTGPLKIILDSKAQRKFLLDNARYIGTETTEAYKRVIIAKYLTPEQRKERGEKIKSRKRQTGDKPSASPTDVRAITTPNKQLVLNDPVPVVVEMALPGLPPSPFGTEQPT